MLKWRCKVVNNMTWITKGPQTVTMHALQAIYSFTTNLDITLMWDVRGVSRVVKQVECVFRGDWWKWTASVNGGANKWNGVVYEGRVDVRVIDWKWEWEAAGDVRKGMKWFGMNNRACTWNRTWKVSWKESLQLDETPKETEGGNFSFLLFRCIVCNDHWIL